MKNEKHHNIMNVAQNTKYSIQQRKQQLQQTIKQPNSLREALAEKLTEKEKEKLRTSFDTIGDIAIIEIHKELEKKEKIIAEELLKLNKHLKVIAKKIGGHKGKYRLQKLKILAGEKRKETTHKEYGLTFQLNTEKCYFSPRLSTERLRIAKLIKPNERVLVMFSGVGAFPLMIERFSQAKEIIGIEWNLIAHKYAEKNLIINKSIRTKFIKGDVKKIVPKLGKFDRIVMPAPHNAGTFIDVTLPAIKKKGWLHIYDIAKEEEIIQHRQTLVQQIHKNHHQCRIVRTILCGQLAPRTHRLCLDTQIQ